MGCASLKLNDNEEKQLSKQLEHTTVIGETLNNIRKKPNAYVKVIQQQLKCFKKRQLVMEIQQSCNTIEYETKQGSKAWKQAIKFLKSQYPINNQLIKSTVLCQAAAQRALYYLHRQQRSKQTSKQNSLSNHNISQQLQMLSGSKVKPGDYAVLVGMDFKLKNRNYIENALIGLIIDDGTSQRTNRNILFSQNYKYYGCFTTMTKDHVLVVICLSSENLQSKI